MPTLPRDLTYTPVCAAQYVRMSTEHQQYSPENQSDVIGRYAAGHGMRIVRTYSDHGRSGLNLSGREGLRHLLDDVQRGACEFHALLVYDVSRWGRFQDVDESAYYEYILKRANIAVHYCAEQFENDGSIGSTLLKTVRRHRDLGARLVYVQDASMSEKAMKIFAADMHELGRDDLAQQVSAHRTEIADLSYYGDEVLLFPDHHAILWRWDPNRDLFDWPASRVKTQRCSDFPTLGVGCSAVEVDPDGKLKK